VNVSASHRLEMTGKWKIRGVPQAEGLKPWGTGEITQQTRDTNKEERGRNARHVNTRGGENKSGVSSNGQGRVKGHVTDFSNVGGPSGRVDRSGKLVNFGIVLAGRVSK